MVNDHYKQLWFQYLTPALQDLVADAFFLKNTFQNDTSQADINDYSFITFPMAKAYEGFIKQYLLDLDLITQKTFESRRFRIGRAINPDVYPQHRDELWLYDDLERECAASTARKLWETWLECRNRVFHYFPGRHRFMSLEDAGNHLEIMAQTMQQAVDCQSPERLGL